MTDMAAGEQDGEAVGRRRRPGRRVLIGLLALAVLAGVVVYLNRDRLIAPPEGCTINTASGKGTLDLSQAANAATIASVAISRGLPERAVTIALATAMQESKLHNIPGGDRDSVGLFQQRPSQGWGTVDQIMDPVYATNKFLDVLVKIPGYARMPLTDAAQQVQRSGYPQAYAKHESNATLVASVLTGRESAALSCVVDDLTVPSQSPTATDSAQPLDVSARVRREFGKTVSAAPAAKADNDPRTVIALTPQPAASTDSGPDALRQSGWAVAQWSVAHSQQLGIGAVAYDGRIWRVDRPNDGWKASTTAPSTDRVLVTLGAPAKS